VRAVAFSLSLALTGCGGALAARPAPPTPAEIRELEARVTDDPADVDARVGLARVRLLEGRPDDAQPLLDAVLAADPGHRDAGLLLGTLHEQRGEFREADERYRAYLAGSPDPALRADVAGRLERVRRELLLAEARALVAREQELVTSAPTPRTVAVFPFLLQTNDPRLDPLGRAMAELLATDLAQTDRLTVLERMRVQMLLDEIALAGSGLVDPATAARSGRLLGAEQVVQGSLSGDEAALQLSAAVVGVTSGEPASTVEEQDALERLFAMEKRLALEIYRSLGIELTPAERERVERRHTDSIEALLAFGLGLQAEDFGDFAAARQNFTRAAVLDPAFDAALLKQAAAEQVANAISPTEIAQRVVIGGEAARLAEIEALVPGLGGRDAAAELFGHEGIGRPGGVVRVILRGGSSVD